TTSARRPASCTACAVASSLPTLRPTSARSAPASASATPAALPIPPPAPVTTATFPSRLNSGGSVIASHRHLATINRQRDAGDHAGLVGHQKKRGARHVFRLGHAAERNSGAKPLHRFFRLRRHAAQDVLEHRSRNHRRTYGIGAHIVGGEFEREAAHQAD